MTDTTKLEEQALSGDAEAFGSLIRGYDFDLRGVVWSVVRSSHATDDVMQVSYEKAFRAIGQFDQRSSLKTWLHSICYRAAVDHLRYEGRRRHASIESGPPSAKVRRVSAVASATDAVDDRLDVSAMLKDLGPDERAMLMMTVGLGYSFDETAQIVGAERGTVASKVSRARAKLASKGFR